MYCCDVKHSKQRSKAIAQEMSQLVYLERFLLPHLQMGGGYILIVVRIFFIFHYFFFKCLNETNGCKDNRDQDVGPAS